MDDGAKDDLQAAGIMEMLGRQRIEHICTAIHYLHHRESIEAFLKRREKALLRLPEEPGLSVTPGAEGAWKKAFVRQKD